MNETKLSLHAASLWSQPSFARLFKLTMLHVSIHFSSLLIERPRASLIMISIASWIRDPVRACLGLQLQLAHSKSRLQLPDRELRIRTKIAVNICAMYELASSAD